MKIRFFLVVPLLLTLLLTACAETRFGQEIKRDEQGNLPQLPEPLPTFDDAQAQITFRNLVNSPEPVQTAPEEKVDEDTQKVREIIHEQWKVTQVKFKVETDENRAQRIRLGRLFKMVEEDKTAIRREVLQLWLIKFQDLKGDEVLKAEKVLHEKVLADTDLNCLAHYAYLQIMIATPILNTHLTDEEKAALIRMEKFYKTGEEENLQDVPKE